MWPFGKAKATEVTFVPPEVEHVYPEHNFGAVEKCEKCGGYYLLYRYVPEKRAISSFGLYIYPTELIHEHLLVTCMKCTYTCTMKTQA